MSDRLTPRQRLAVELLAHGASRKEAALRIACDVKTLQRWQQSPVFREALHVQTGIAATETVRKMQALQGKALEVLAKAMDGGSEKTQLQAALRVLADVAPLPAKDDALARQIKLTAQQNTPGYGNELQEALREGVRILQSHNIFEKKHHDQRNETRCTG